MAQLDRLFKAVIDNKGSDLHIASKTPSYMRVHGSLNRLEMAPFTHEQCLAMFLEIMTDRNKEEFKKKRQVDFSYALDGEGRFRCNIYLKQHGVGGSFRLIPSKVLTAEQLGLPDAIIKLCALHKGLVVVTGPTGSGKSTTLAAMIDFINDNRREHIITVEDPVEFLHVDKNCMISQRQLGDHVTSFADALRAALREDPDVILVGEMRDLETISLAITAAETGHLVFGTLHTTSAAKTVDRIIDAFPQAQQEMIRTILSEGLKGIVAQVLLKRADGKGRVAAFEILTGTPALSNVIRENKTFQIPSLMQTQKEQGNVLLDVSLAELVKKRLVRPNDALDHVVDRKGFHKMLQGLE